MIHRRSAIPALATMALLAAALVAEEAGAFMVTDPPLGTGVVGPTPNPVIDHDPADLRFAGTVPWDLLRELELTYDSPFPGQTSFTTRFTAALEELDGQEVKLAGFLYPLEPGSEHAHFLLAAFPPSCPFCLPGGPTDLVEVNSTMPIGFTDDPIVLIGRFQLLTEDPSGMLYRLEQARLVE